MDERRGPQVVELAIGDEPGGWERAGFAVQDSMIGIGSLRLRLGGSEDGRRGIRSWTIADPGAPSEIDGLPTIGSDAIDPPDMVEHPNRVVGLDHLVVFTPDCDRTTAALEANGFPARRLRQFETRDGTRRQTFFWAGDAIVELVGPDDASGDGPAELWGLALVSADLDATAALLGEAISRPKDAVQPGRRIAALRHRELDVSVPVAFMTPHR